MKTTLTNGREIEYGDIINHHTTTHFDFMDRIKILFGIPLQVTSKIYVKEQCHVIASEAKPFIPKLFYKIIHRKTKGLMAPSEYGQKVNS